MSFLGCIRAGEDRVRLFLLLGLLSPGALFTVLTNAQVTGQPTGQIPPKEPLEILSPVPSGVCGELIYSSRIPIQGRPKAGPYNLVLHAIHTATGKTSDEAIRVTPDFADVIFDPQFSPDGSKIIFKSGWPLDKHGMYRVYIWDRKSRALTNGPPEPVTYQRIIMSPDGRYLAYITGGDSEGIVRRAEESLTLHLFDLSSKASKTISQNPYVTGIAWTPENRLLYVAATSSNVLGADFGGSKSLSAVIHEFDPGTGRDKKLIKNVYVPENPLLDMNVPCPSPSPDGRWIAFLGTEWAIPPGTSKNQLGLNRQLPSADGVWFNLFNRLTGKIRSVQALRVLDEDYVRWSPDSNRLVVMQSKRLETGSEAHIISINPSTLAAKIVTAIPALDIQSVNWGRTHRQFRLLSISNDGVNLYLTKSQITGRQDFSFIQITELQAVDLSRGTVTPVARIKNIEADSLGLDWRDKSQTLSPRSR